ncbi:MAG TPA: hypothetical protein VG368_04785 [Acidimicrobiales bacterium]|nr:hypothetical protein [Acidimicrobiales bacterium]
MSASADAAPVPPPENPRQHAQEVLDRSNAVHALADKAVQLDGTPQTGQIANNILYCRASTEICINAAKEAEKVSKVGAYAGLAAYLADQVNPRMVYTWILQNEHDVRDGEMLAKRAMEEAQKVVDARAAQERTMNAEVQAISAATDDCSKNEAGCKTKCDHDNDGSYCLAWAVRLRNAKTPKLADARAYFQKACDAGNQHGCVSVPGIDQQVQEAAAQVDRLWSDVTALGDDLAQKHHQAAMVRQIANTPRNMLALQRMQVIDAAIVNEKYCPAKWAFIQGASAAEFAKRAAAHCKDDAPTGPGLSGAEVTLTAECQQVYATGCP